MFTMSPPPLAISVGANARIMWYTPRRFVFMILSQVSGSVSWSGESANSGVVDYDFQLLLAITKPIGQLLDVSERTDIANYPFTFRAALPNALRRFLEFVVFACSDHDLGSKLSELRRDCESNASASAGYNRNFPFQWSRHEILLSRFWFASRPCLPRCSREAARASSSR